jgi:SAM-dependent methyltransferase
MHLAARRFVQSVIGRLRPASNILEIGSRDVNGSVRKLFPNIRYTGIDTTPGPGVDIVADGGRFRWLDCFDLVLCLEVLEHAENARAVCRNAYDLLDPNGVFLVTAAGPERLAHSGVDGGPLRAGEYYRGVTAELLREWLALFAVVLIDVSQPTDIYALAIK